MIEYNFSQIKQKIQILYKKQNKVLYILAIKFIQMHTRKSSPLPSPKDTTQMYEINYKVHYQNLHKYLMGLIRNEQRQKNILIKKFTDLIAELSKLNMSSREPSQQFIKIEEQIKTTIHSFYDEICKKELQIKKLYDEAEGVIVQLQELLVSKKEQMQSIRNKCGKSSDKVIFLNMQKINQSISETQYTKSIEQKQTEYQSQIIKKPQQTSQLKSNQKINIQKEVIPLDPALTSQKQRKLSNQRQIITPQQLIECEEALTNNTTQQQKIPVKQTEQISISIPIEIQTSKQHKCEQVYSETNQNPFELKGTGHLKLEQFAGLDKQIKNRKQNQRLHGIIQCIQINSSNDQRLFENKDIMTHSQSKTTYTYSEMDRIIQSPPKTSKSKKITKCITIMDDQ